MPFVRQTTGRDRSSFACEIEVATIGKTLDSGNLGVPAIVGYVPTVFSTAKDNLFSTLESRDWFAV